MPGTSFAGTARVRDALDNLDRVRSIQFLEQNT